MGAGKSKASKVTTNSKSSTPNSSNKQQAEVLRIVETPIYQYTHGDFIILMKYLEVPQDLFERFETILNSTNLIFGGLKFKSLHQSIHRNDQTEVSCERKRIIKQCRKLLKEYEEVQVSDDELNIFFDRVIIAKINRDYVRSKNLKETPYSKLETSLNPSHSIIAKQVDWESLSHDHLQLFSDEMLTKKEKKAVEFCAKKLEEAKIVAEVQNWVCEDRFLYENFYLPIRHTPERRSLETPAGMSVKLVISEIGNQINKKIGIAGTLIPATFGIFHVGLIIGQWQLDWYNDSLVSVRNKFITTNAIAVIDLGMLNDSRDIMEAFKSIASICCLFNGTKNYNPLLCNCQHFVSRILKSISMRMEKNAAIQGYLKDIKKGKGRVYHYTKELKDIVSHSPVSKYSAMELIEFDKRSEVNDFCHWLNGLGYFELDAGKQDYRLLKAFDRSFHIAGVELSGTGFVPFFAENEKLAEITLEKPRYNVGDMDITQMIPKRISDIN